MDDQPIMLIEDNPDDRDLTIRAFRKNGILNPVAGDGAEALTMLLGDDHRDQGNPALILLDLKLPKVGGLEVLRRIRADERTRVVPVLVLTSSKEEEARAARTGGWASRPARGARPAASGKMTDTW